jgi:hypothetical protein
MNGQNNTRLTRGLSALVVLVSALWGMVPAAPGASRVAVPLLSRKTARATGDDTALAVTTGGGQTCSIWNNALYCWGFNMYGQIGGGTTNVRYTPTLVQGMDSGVTDVSAGSRHTCAIKNGALYCWGSNYYGQLGDGTTTNRLTPVAVQGMSSGGNYASAQSNNTFGPQAAQNVVAWSGSLAPGAAHTLSYVVQVVILEGQIINQPRVYVNNEDTSIDLGSTVQVEARKAHIPIVRRQ